MKKGKCIPDDLRWADEICDAQENSTVTLNGVIALAGINSEILHSSDINVLSHVIATIVDGWTADKIVITGSSLDVRSLSVDKRSLNAFTHDIAFSVSFVAEDFGIDGATYGVVENLVSDMTSTIEASLSSGAFTSSLSASAMLSKSVLMGAVTSGELVSLDIQAIAYAHSHLVYVYIENEKASAPVTTYSTSNGGMSSNMIAAGGIVCVLAFVAFVGIATHNFNGYNKISASSDSEVRSVNVAAVNNEVELEQVSHPFANSDGVGAKRMVFPTRRV